MGSQQLKDKKKKHPIKTFTEQEEADLIKEMCLLDDVFFTKCFDENIDGTQLLLQIVLRAAGINDKIRIMESISQRWYQHLTGRSVKRDLLAKDLTGDLYGVEMQRKTEGASLKRARTVASTLDQYAINKGEDFDDLKNSTVIFFTEKDTIGNGKPLTVFKVYNVTDQKTQTLD